MAGDTITQRIDPILRPFLQAVAGPESQLLLERLVCECAEPIIKNIIRHKLRVSFNRSGQRQDFEAEDVYGDVVVELIERLREVKAAPDEKAIANFRSYVAALAYNVCNERLRRKYPERHSLKNKLRYLMTNQKGFALWESGDKDWLCGFAAWQGKPPISQSRLQQLRASPEALERAELSSKDLKRMNMADLAAAIFNWAGAPIALDDLVGIVADLRGIKEPREQSQPDESEEETIGLDERLPDPRVNVATEVDQRMYLQRLWAEICLLPPRQRAALLLNLKDKEGRDVIALLPITGTATIRQIAESLGMSVEQFAPMWNDLPLDDAAIASSLGITRQQVINLRKSARQRLIRRMRES